jgi:hypothetical protein
MKIKDLPKNISLEGIRFIYPLDGKPYYWTSQWNKGVWGKTSLSDNQIYPLFVNELEDVLEWEVVK